VACIYLLPRSPSGSFAIAACVTGRRQSTQSQTPAPLRELRGGSEGCAGAAGTRAA